MFHSFVGYSQLATGMMLAVLLTGAAANADSAADRVAQSVVSSNSNTQLAALSRQRRPDRTIRRRPVGSPRRLPPNLVQPGGGLDVAAQSCDPQSRPLTALVPVENPVFTASAHPTFLFYLPDAPEQVDYVEFILLTADEKEEIYTAQFVPTAAGIISISLPAKAENALSMNGAYHWYLNLHCESNSAGSTASNPTVNGWVQRLPQTEVTPIESALTADLTAGVPVSETGLPEVWYDAIAQVAEALENESTLQTQTPQIRRLWNNWLSAAGLAEVADAPVVGAVLPEP